LQKAVAVQDRTEFEQIHKGLQKVFEVSAYLDFPFTLDEVATYFLPNAKVTGEQLRSLIASGKFDDLPFQIRGAYLLTSPTQSETARVGLEEMCAAKLSSAAAFAASLTRLVPFIRTVAVTGSVAYGSADKWDDIDLFIITKRNRLWLSALMTLVLVRLSKFLRLRPPHLSLFCLSYVHDDLGFANESYENRTNPLFARELVKAKPVAGKNEYRKILEENGWVGDLYPSPYVVRLRELANGLNSSNVVGKVGPTPYSRSFLAGWAEGIVFVLLSRYLRLRAYLTNLKLTSQGKQLRVFEPRMSAVSCVYTSNFYMWLQALWSEQLPP
jgi:hypothetical protein